MSSFTIDWYELSMQVTMTFVHFLWQACVVAIVLHVGDSLRDSQIHRRHRGPGKLLPHGSDRNIGRVAQPSSGVWFDTFASSEVASRLRMTGRELKWLVIFPWVEVDEHPLAELQVGRVPTEVIADELIICIDPVRIGLRCLSTEVLNCRKQLLAIPLGTNFAIAQ